MRLTLAGYFPKIPAKLPGREICSVSNCITAAPEGWIQRWLHNELWFFNTPDDARAVADERFELFAYRILEACFVDGLRHSWTPPPLVVTPLPANYVSIGFDAVSRSTGAAFECSPLSCNYMATEIPVNQYCLAETLEAAIGLAERFSREKPEPGDYYVFEVLRAIID